MSAASDTVARLRLETANVQAKHTARLAPQERGERLVTLARSAFEELRVTWDEFKGHPYLSLRVWTRGTDGQWWPDRARGCSIRIRELEAFAAAIDTAIERAAASDDGGGLGYD